MMDANTLNDLLECSVCLDRLDTSSKVLPCQHTYCRKCLEVIVASHRELRCPECRVLVTATIDELPPNVLLMRILEGMKSAKTTTHAKKDNTLNVVDITDEAQNSSRHKESYQPNGQKQLSHSLQNITTHENSTAVLHNRSTITNNSARGERRRNLGNVPHAFALHDFRSSNPRDLCFKKGDLILLGRRIDANWYMGMAHGKEGPFPINYVQIAVPLPTPQCLALYDFKMGPSEEEGCLRFQKGTVIKVIRRVDKNWAEGSIGSNIGIFPIAFVELNPLAKQLLEDAVSTPQTRDNHTQPQQTLQTRNLPPIPLLDPTINTHSTTSSSSSLATNSPNSANTTTSNWHSSTHSTAGTLNQSLPNTPQHNAGDSVRFRHSVHKRHSLNALIGCGNAATPTLSVLQTNRHSAEILSIPDGNLNPTATTSASQPHTPDMGSEVRLNAQQATKRSQPTVAAMEQQAAMLPNSNGRVSVIQSLSGRPNLPWSYVALYPYKPQKADELELKKGCVYIVTERCLDGWFKGKNWQDMSGVFPGNYVVPLRTRDQQQLTHQSKFVSPQMPTTATNTGLNNQANPTCGTTKNHTVYAETHAGGNAAHVQQQPPDLPPRCLGQSHQWQGGASTTSTQVWPKHFGNKIENFFVGGNCATSNKKQKITQPQFSKEPNNKENPSATSSLSVAEKVMKRLSSIKSRSKSPNMLKHGSDFIPLPEATSEHQLQHLGDVVLRLAERDTALINNIQHVHVRSGSCPSKFVQSGVVDLTVPHPPNQRQQQKCTTQVTYGSQRLKGLKERPPCPYTQLNLITAPTVQQHQEQSQPQLPKSTQLNLLFSSLNHQEHNHAAIQHRKSQSLDAGNVLTPPMQTPNDQVTNYLFRVRCGVPYPPNGDIELELQVGDIIFVERKLKNGWYKGTNQRNGKTGLFPATFVEPHK